MHDIGRWYYYKLKTEVPPFPEGTLLHMPRPTLAGNVFEQLVHCGSMYGLASSVLNGLAPSAVPPKRGKLGLWTYQTRSRKVMASKSSGYCCYDSLCSCGHDIFFGPRFMLEGQMWGTCEGIGGFAAGCGQQCIPAGLYHLVGVYVHVMTRDDLDLCPEDSETRDLWFNCGRWDPRFEKDPMSVKWHA